MRAQNEHQLAGMRPWRLLWKRNGPGARLPPTRILRLRLMLAATAHERSQANLVQENHTGSICNQSSISSHCTLCGTPYTWTRGDSSSRHRMPILGVSSLDFRPLSSGLLFTPGAFCNLRSRGKGKRNCTKSVVNAARPCASVARLARDQVPPGPRRAEPT